MENNSKYVISEATEKEFKEILKIKNDSKSNTYKFEQKQFFVARDNGKMVGFARLRVDKKTGKVDLGGLYVDPDYRGTKIGYDLFKHIIDNSDFEEYFLDCIKPLENYYLKFGFTTLEKPEDFQIEKIKGIYKMYNLEYDEKEVLEKTLFMKYEKKIGLN